MERCIAHVTGRRISGGELIHRGFYIIVKFGRQTHVIEKTYSSVSQPARIQCRNWHSVFIGEYAEFGIHGSSVTSPDGWAVFAQAEEIALVIPRHPSACPTQNHQYIFVQWHLRRAPRQCGARRTPSSASKQGTLSPMTLSTIRSTISLLHHLSAAQRTQRRIPQEIWDFSLRYFTCGAACHGHLGWMHHWLIAGGVT